MPRQQIANKIGSGGWNGHFTVEQPVLKPGYVLARNFNSNEAQKLAHAGHEHDDDEIDSAQQQQQQKQAAAAAFSTAAPPPTPANSCATPAREITHTIQRAPADQLDSNGSDFHARASHTTVLPTAWDGTFAPGAPYRPKPSAHTNTSNFYGHSTEPTVLPARWDGKFAPGSGAPYRPKPSPYTNTNNFYGFDTAPTVLPTQWDGKFQPAGPGNTYTVPDRNGSATNDFYGYNNETTVLPTQWSGKFELDPNDVRLKPERNQSDVRDYADHRNFRTVQN